jgi:hypothetical protein
MMETKQKLVNALTEYDRKQSTRRGYNHHALALYFQALDEAEAAVTKGKEWKIALQGVFNDRVLDVCLKAIGHTDACVSANDRSAREICIC